MKKLAGSNSKIFDTGSTAILFSFKITIMASIDRPGKSIRKPINPSISSNKLK